ncbi:MAG TPA: DNA-binding domain-containing protein [Micropepsaceae bacterium]|nr:DNA-binding domain-containing protein [Micropepsaceae bacterium]
MPTLLELQRSISKAILSRETDEAAHLFVGDGLIPHERLNIYRNTFLAGLTSALRISFPAVHRLVGAEFFDGAAQCFIEAEPPQSANLYLYGAGFADFLARFSPAASLVYLPDVAHLEWAVNCALHASDAAPLAPECYTAIAEADPARLMLAPHPSLTMLRLEYPADAIWRAVLAEDDEALSAINLAAGPCWLLVERDAEGIEVSRLSEAEWRFASALSAGETFATATDRAGTIDMPLLFAGHLAAGRFVGFRIVATQFPSWESPT